MFCVWTIIACLVVKWFIVLFLVTAQSAIDIISWSQTTIQSEAPERFESQSSPYYRCHHPFSNLHHVLLRCSGSTTPRQAFPPFLPPSPFALFLPVCRGGKNWASNLWQQAIASACPDCSPWRPGTFGWMERLILLDCVGVNVCDLAGGIGSRWKRQACGNRQSEGAHHRSFLSVSITRRGAHDSRAQRLLTVQCGFQVKIMENCTEPMAVYTEMHRKHSAGFHSTYLHILCALMKMWLKKKRTSVCFNRLCCAN